MAAANVLSVADAAETAAVTADGFGVTRTAGTNPARTSSKQASISGPLKQSGNLNYFEDAHGAPLILCGSLSWNTLQDWGTDGLVRPLDFDAFVRFLEAHGHNFTLLWCVELPKFRGLPTTELASPDFTVSPFPWPRTGPGHATDGGLKFDLTRFDQAYFDRLRSNLQGFEIGNTLLREFPVLLDKVVFDPAHRRRGEGLPPIDGALTSRNLRVSPPAPPR